MDVWEDLVIELIHHGADLHHLRGIQGCLLATPTQGAVLAALYSGKTALTLVTSLVCVGSTK